MILEIMVEIGVVKFYKISKVGRSTGDFGTFIVRERNVLNIILLLIKYTACIRLCIVISGGKDAHNNIIYVSYFVLFVSCTFGSSPHQQLTGWSLYGQNEDCS